MPENPRVRVWAVGELDKTVLSYCCTLKIQANTRPNAMFVIQTMQVAREINRQNASCERRARPNVSAAK